MFDLEALLDCAIRFICFIRGISNHIMAIRAEIRLEKFSEPKTFSQCGGVAGGHKGKKGGWTDENREREDRWNAGLCNFVRHILGTSQ